MLCFYGHSSAAVPAPRVCFTSVWFSFSASPPAQSLLHTTPWALPLSAFSRHTWLVGLLPPSGNCCLGTFAAIMPTQCKFPKHHCFFHVNRKVEGGHWRRGGGTYAFFYLSVFIFLVGEETSEKSRVLLHIALDQEALILFFFFSIYNCTLCVLIFLSPSPPCSCQPCLFFCLPHFDTERVVPAIRSAFQHEHWTWFPLFSLQGCASPSPLFHIDLESLLPLSPIWQRVVTHTLS